MRSSRIWKWVCLLTAGLILMSGATPPRAKKIVLIAGAKSHAPGAHEYLKSVKLLKVLLDRSPNVGKLRTEVHFNGWPEDAATLDTADTIVIISEGQPGDKNPPVPFMTSERMKVMEKQMQRGCGIVTIHYTTFITYAFVDQILEWQGGYYEWKGPPERRSAIKTLETDLKLGAPDHPISNGLQPFKFKDEYYYKLRFRENDPRLKPILQVPALSEVPEQQIVAWAVERQGGGRSFATTTGHFFENWKNDSYRKLMLNAIFWTAGGEVPAGGVQSTYVDPTVVDQALLTKPIPALLVMGADPTDPQAADRSAAIISALNSETPRFQMKIVAKLEPEDLSRYKLVLVSHNDLPGFGLSANSRKRLIHYVKRGGGLSLVRSGAWPEFQVIADRPRSTVPAHEPNAVYRVRMAGSTPAVTGKIDPFEATDQFSKDALDRAGPQILAIAQLKAGGPDQPVASIHRYFKGRIFQTVLGRDVAALQIPGTVQLIRYGSLWAAEGK